MSDSAGVTIVENASAETPTVYAMAGPFLEIGEVAGAEEYELHDVAAVVRLPSGGVTAAIGGAEIRWYDADGRFLRRAGRPGSGPGEFRSIRYMRRLHGDSLLVSDGANRRLTVFDPEGGYVRDRTLRMDGEVPVNVVGALRDGTILIRTVLETPPASTPLYRPRLQYALLRGDEAQRLGEYAGPEAAMHVDGSGGGINSVFVSVLPFGRAAHASAGPDRFFLGSSDAFQIDVWDATGRLVRIIRLARPAMPVTEDLREAYIENEVGRRRQLAMERGESFQEGEVTRQLQEQKHAPAVPAFSSLLATEEGGLWVKEFTMPGAEAAPPQWTIFDVEGRITGIIEVPPRFTPMHVERDVVLGVFHDGLDVPFLRAYTFETPAR